MKDNKVDAYIAVQPAAQQPMLESIRTVIRKMVPDAEETVSYMIPCYKWHGMLVGFGTHKKGCSFYVMNNGILKALFAKDLAGFEYSGSTIHLDVNKPLPVALIKKIIRARMQENEEREAMKKDMQAAKKAAVKKTVAKKSTKKTIK